MSGTSLSLALKGDNSGDDSVLGPQKCSRYAAPCRSYQVGRSHGSSKAASPTNTPYFLSGACLAIGILSFPAGWDNDEVRGVCGPQVGYQQRAPLLDPVQINASNISGRRLQPGLLRYPLGLRAGGGRFFRLPHPWMPCFHPGH